MRLIIGYTLEACPEDVINAWALQPVSNPLSETSTLKRTLFSGPALLAMQSHLPALTITPPELQTTHLTEAGHAHRQAEEKLLEQTRQAALEKQLKKKDGSPKKSNTTTGPTKPSIDIPSGRSDEEQKLRKVVQHELDHYDLSKPDSPSRKGSGPGSIPLTPPASPPSSLGLKSILKTSATFPEGLEEESPLKGIRVLRTASAKLNYLLSRIQELSPQEKIIVFSDYAPIMWYLGEALELLGIEHLIYIQRLVHLL